MPTLDDDVRHWLQIKPQPGVSRTLLREQFTFDTGLEISVQHFRRLVKKSGKLRKVCMGAADLSIRDVPGVMVERAFHQILAWNTLSIDEKPFPLKDIVPDKCWIAKGSDERVIWKPLYKMLSGGPIYMVMLLGFADLCCSHCPTSPTRRNCSTNSCGRSFR